MEPKKPIPFNKMTPRERRIYQQGCQWGWEHGITEGKSLLRAEFRELLQAEEAGEAARLTRNN